MWRRRRIALILEVVHDHGHDHGHRRSSQRRLSLALVLAASYMVAEAVGGLWTGSLALLADAGHMLSDVAALSLSVLALRLAQRPGTAQQTYGHHRTEILAALAHGVLLAGVSLTIVVEAVERLPAARQVRWSLDVDPIELF